MHSFRQGQLLGHSQVLREDSLVYGPYAQQTLRDYPRVGYLLWGRPFLVGMVCHLWVGWLCLVLLAVGYFSEEMKLAEIEELKTQTKNSYGKNNLKLKLRSAFGVSPKLF